MPRATLIRGGFLLDGQEVVILDDNLIIIKEKSLIKVESGQTATGRKKVMQRFLTGETNSESKRAFEKAILDIKIARRFATQGLLQAKKESAESDPAASRWSFTDRQKTKRVKELAAIDAIEELVEVALPALDGCAATKMVLKADTDLRKSLLVEFNQANLEYLVACYRVHKKANSSSAASSEAIVWDATKEVWQATRIEEDLVYCCFCSCVFVSCCWCMCVTALVSLL